MKLQTHLISGAGNTFHIAFGDYNFSEKQLVKLTLKICGENPADGFIILKGSGNQYGWQFYNNDGSKAEMCGNATRCVGYYLKMIKSDAREDWDLTTLAGPVNIKMLSKEIYRIMMPPLKILKSPHGFYCNSGVPHLVLARPGFQISEALRKEAKNFRFHANFLPKGTNVTYVSLLSENGRMKAASYERGVEDFTLACGTGAVAAAAYNLSFRGAVQTQVEMPGGTLIMDLADLHKPVMTGPAVLLGSFEYEISDAI